MYTDLTLQHKAQLLFESVARHLINQGAPAVVGGSCKYRTGWRRCAIGHLIPDGRYNSKMEGKDVSALIEEFGFVEFSPHKDLLRALQQVHDSDTAYPSRPLLWNSDRTFNIPHLKAALYGVGTAFNLDCNFLRSR